MLKPATQSARICEGVRVQLESICALEGERIRQRNVLVDPADGSDNERLFDCDSDAWHHVQGTIGWRRIYVDVDLLQHTRLVIMDKEKGGVRQRTSANPVALPSYTSNRNR